MDSFPHHYRVATRAGPEGPLDNNNDESLALQSAPPKQFGGDGKHWSPEHLLAASVSGCLVLTFRAVTAASGFIWEAIDCQVEGTLDRVERAMRFTRFDVRVKLAAPQSDPDKARALLDKAKANCLVSNSLNAEITLHLALVDSL